jgi:hypothetical protein
MSKLRRQLSANTPNIVETKNLVDIKAKTGNLYESIAIVAKRANQINIALKEELHNKLEEFASHTDSLERSMKTRSKSRYPRHMRRCLTPQFLQRRSLWRTRSIIVKTMTIFSVERHNT